MRLIQEFFIRMNSTTFASFTIIILWCCLAIALKGIRTLSHWWVYEEWLITIAHAWKKNEYSFKSIAHFLDFKTKEHLQVTLDIAHAHWNISTIMQNKFLSIALTSSETTFCLMSVSMLKSYTLGSIRKTFDVTIKLYTSRVL